MKSTLFVLLSLWISVLGLTSSAEAKIINVPADFESIQDAIQAADRFDEVVLAPGTYEENDLNMRKTQLIVRSTDPNDPAIVASTIIDGGGNGRLFIFEQDEKRTSQVIGLTLTNGFEEQGGAIFINNASPTFDRVVITGNVAEKGGGIVCFGPQAKPLFIDSEISNNEAIGSDNLVDDDALGGDLAGLLKRSDRSRGGVVASVGGGMKAVDCSPEVVNTVVTGNGAGQGAGLYFRSSAGQVTNSLITGNDAGWGGGLHFRLSPAARVSGTEVTQNTAVFGGGGIGIDESDMLIESSEIHNNTGTGFGGGIVISKARPQIISTLVRDNNTNSDGGGLAVFTTVGPEIINSTFSQNNASRGGGLFFAEMSSGTVTNSIVWDNAAEEIFAVDQPVTVTFSDIEGGWPGEGNLDVDPLFVDPGSDDFHLQAGSPVIDVALAESAPPGDIDGNIRPGGPAFDMGADEFYGPPRLLDVPGQFASIQAAIDIAFNGDEIVLAPGNYLEADISFDGKAVTVRGTDPSDPAVTAATVVNGGGAGTVFNFLSQETSQSVLSGITITGGNAPSAGGIFIDSASPTIDRCNITGNIASAGLGGGIYSTGGSPLIIGSLVTGNRAVGCGDPNLCGNGGGMYLVNGLPIVEDTTVDDNIAEAAGGGIYTETGTIIGGSVSNNTADQGGGIYAVNSKVQNTQVGPGNGATREGGGLYCQDSEVRDATVEGNSANKGGGLVLTDSDMIDSFVAGNDATEEGGGTWLGEIFFSTIQGNTTDGDGGGGSQISLLRESFILDNTAGSRGGGLFNAQIVRETIITGNEAERGGGAFVQNGLADESSMTDSVLDNNRATYGGGVAMQAVWPPPHWADIRAIRLTDSTVNGNQATLQGGGIYCDECITRLLSTDLNDNSSDFQGGAIYITPTTSDSADPSLTVEAATIARSSAVEEGGAIYCGVEGIAEFSSVAVWGSTATSGAAFYSDSCALSLRSTTVSANTASGQGGALLTTSAEDTNSRPNVVNSILWGNSPDEIIVLSLGLPEVRFSDVAGGWPGDGNIDVDPLFVNNDPINGDFHLTQISSVMDKGDGSQAPEQDFDRAERVVGIAIDLGADEFQLDDPQEEGIPSITEVFPTQGTVVGGEPVTITGENFGGFSQVFFGSREADVVSIAVDSLEVLSPSGSVGFVNVKVTNFGDFDATKVGAYEYILPPPPLPLSVNPDNGSLEGGEEVTITGQNFTTPMTVIFGLNFGTEVIVLSDTQLTVKTPVGPFGGPVDVVLEDQYDQTGVLLDGFNYNGPIPPQVDSVSPNSGPISGGTLVTLTGANFSDNVRVFFGDNEAAAVNFITEEEIRASTPPSSIIGPVDVTVRDEFDQDGVLPGGFEYLPEVDPAISSLDPSSGSTAGGDTVTINGQGFADPMVLFVDGEETRVTFIDTETLEFITPPHAAAPGCASDVVEIRVVRNDDKEASSTFSYDPVQVIDVEPGDSIQAAINSAANGACIRLRENEFPGYVENIDIVGKTIAIYGEFPAEPERTVINGSGSSQPVVDYVNADGVGSLLRGVALVLGDGGVEVNSSNPVLEDLLIQDNERLGDGGGIGIFGASAPTVRNSFITLNSSTSQGGGIYLQSGAEVELEGNLITLNTAEEGGGIWVGTDNVLDLTGQRVEFNDATEQEGGGLWLGERSVVTLTDAEIVGNTANTFGGGIVADDDVVLTLIDSIVDSNIAREHGGGIWANTGTQLLATGGSVSGNIAGFRVTPPSQGAGSGAGIYGFEEVVVDIQDVLFDGNSGNSELSEGGAIWLGDFSEGSIAGNRMVENQAQIGGAIALKSRTDLVVDRNEVACNAAVQNAVPGDENPPTFFAPGIFVEDSRSSFFNNTVVGNTGGNVETGGLHTVAPFLLPDVVNNIFASNTGYGLYCSPGSTLGRLDYNLYSDNTFGDVLNCTAGSNAVFAPPMFVNPVCPDPDLGLMPGSPAIDAGDPTFDVPPGGGAIIDIGANEFGT